MITPQPLSAFIGLVQQNQRTICSTIDLPITHTLAVLILSIPVSFIVTGDAVSIIFNFFGVFWIFKGPSSITGFFSTEEEAIQYARSCFAETRDAEMSSR